MRTQYDRFAPLQSHVFAILIALVGRSRPAYDIKAQMKLDTAGLREVGDSTFYPALARLVERGWVEQTSESSRSLYYLTQAGETAARRELERLRDVVAVAKQRFVAHEFGVREHLY
jgi:DNA-binding PadR family transcriptional regulator